MRKKREGSGSVPQTDGSGSGRPKNMIPDPDLEHWEKLKFYNPGWIRDPQPACDREDGGGGKGVRQHVPAPAGQLCRDQRRAPHLSSQVSQSGVLIFLSKSTFTFPGSGKTYPGSRGLTVTGNTGFWAFVFLLFKVTLNCKGVNLLSFFCR